MGDENKGAEVTHGEKWYIKKIGHNVSEDGGWHFQGIGERDPLGTMLYYKMKLRASFGLCNAYETMSENYAAVEIYCLYCDMHGFENTLRKKDF